MSLSQFLLFPFRSRLWNDCTWWTVPHSQKSRWELQACVFFPSDLRYIAFLEWIRILSEWKAIRQTDTCLKLICFLLRTDASITWNPIRERERNRETVIAGGWKRTDLNNLLLWRRFWNLLRSEGNVTLNCKACQSLFLVFGGKFRWALTWCRLFRVGQ